MPTQYDKKINAISEFDAFTGGQSKTAEMAIYYNVAVSNIERLNAVFQSKGYSAIQQRNYLAEYLWKASKESKNSAGYNVTKEDISIMDELQTLMTSIRNYHSHVWHDNKALTCSDAFSDFLKNKYDLALLRISEEDPIGVKDFEQLMHNCRYEKYSNLTKKYNGFQYLTEEGRIFLLSFALTTGQMSQLLQQRKGSKRTDLPLFRIKHKLYKYYCHRDGANISHFNHDSSILESLPETEKSDIHKARTAFKLINYLNDMPDYWGDSIVMPLYLSGSLKPVQNVNQLISYIKEHQLLKGFNFWPLKADCIEATIQEDEQFHKGTIAFNFNRIAPHFFHIAYDTLHRLVLLCLLKNVEDVDRSMPRMDTESIFIENLHRVANNRNEVARVLKIKPNQRTPEENSYLLDKRNQLLRGSRKLTEKSIVFFERLEKGTEKQIDAESLASMIICGEAVLSELIKLQEPIMIYRQDLVSTTTQKFRPGNRFMQYATKFLMDFIGTDVHWGMEKFEIDSSNKATSDTLRKRKKYFRAVDIPDGYKLTVEQDHIFIGISKNKTATTNYQRYHQFSIGPKAMKYLTAYCLNNKDYPTKIKDFFENLTQDIDQIILNKGKDTKGPYNVLDKPFLPGYVIMEEATNWEAFRQKIASRIAYILLSWNEILKKSNTLKRAEKNRIIMDVYRLFDWPQDQNTHIKFLRKNEYSHLSICHYSLKDKNKFNELFYSFFRLNNRKPAIPYAIKELLIISESLDDLLKRVIEDRSLMLKSKMDLIKDLPIAILKKEAEQLCRLLGLSIPIHLHRQERIQIIEKERQQTFELLPYPVDPMMVYKFFFPKEYENGINDYRIASNNNGKIKTRATIPVFINLRKSQANIRGLSEDHYPHQLPQLLYPGEELPKQQKKLIGQINNTLTEDIILWWMARQYLTGNTYTAELAEKLKSDNSSGYNVGNLHGTKLVIPIKPKGTEPSQYGTIYISAYGHQMDDLMFAKDKTQLRHVAIHYINRCTKERNLWSDQDLWKRKLSDHENLPDGTKPLPISYDVLREEIQFIRNCSKKFVDQVLNFERKVFQSASAILSSNNNDHLQIILKAKRANDPSNNFFYYNFKQTFELATELKMEHISTLKNHLTDLENFRNMALHNDIPLQGSFSWFTREGTDFREALGLKEDLHIKRDRDSYFLEVPEFQN